MKSISIFVGLVLLGWGSTLIASRWSEHVSGSAFGSSEASTRAQAEMNCRMQANNVVFRCQNEGGSPMSTGCSAFCHALGNQWRCSADGNVYCTKIRPGVS